VADFNNPDGENIVLNGINDSIISLPDPIALLAGKLFTIALKRQDHGEFVGGFFMSHLSG
jgi:hypothetical protein